MASNPLSNCSRSFWSFLIKKRTIKEPRGKASKSFYLWIKSHLDHRNGSFDHWDRMSFCVRRIDVRTIEELLKRRDWHAKSWTIAIAEGGSRKRLTWDCQRIADHGSQMEADLIIIAKEEQVGSDEMSPLSCCKKEMSQTRVKCGNAVYSHVADWWSEESRVLYER